jgi:hypothetical protein
MTLGPLDRKQRRGPCVREALLPEKDRPDKENQTRTRKTKLTPVRVSGARSHSVSCGGWTIQHPLVRGVGILKFNLIDILLQSYALFEVKCTL